MATDGPKTMNGVLRAQFERTRGISTGGVDRLAGVPTTEQARERLSQALNDCESAHRRGDETEIAIVEDRLDQLIAESRASREQPRDEQGRFAGGSFDGGVRQSVKKPQGMNGLLKGLATAR